MASDLTVWGLRLRCLEAASFAVKRGDPPGIFIGGKNVSFVRIVAIGKGWCYGEIEVLHYTKPFSLGVDRRLYHVSLPSTLLESVEKGW